MHKKVAKLDRIFTSLAPYINDQLRHRYRSKMPRSAPARQRTRAVRRADLLAQMPRVRSQRDCHLAKPSASGASVEEVDAIEFKSQATANARGGTRRRPDATGEWTSDGGTENTSCDDFPRVTESMQACARHGRARKPTTHGRREDTTRDCGALRAPYWYGEQNGAREDVENHYKSSSQHRK